MCRYVAECDRRDILKPEFQWPEAGDVSLQPCPSEAVGTRCEEVEVLSGIWEVLQSRDDLLHLVFYIVDV